MVYQVNEPGTVGDGVNRKNKQGSLALGDDGQCLRNVKVDPDGITVVRHSGPVDVVPHLTKVHGTVNVGNVLTVNPVTVSNMPTEMRVQEGLHIVQTPREVRVAPFNFAGRGLVVLSKPCRLYAVYVTVYDPMFIEIVGITGEMWTRELKFNLFPQFIQVNQVEISVREYTDAGGYILYENC